MSPHAIARRAGIGLRAPHASEVVDARPAVGWLEVHTENYLCGGPALRALEAARRDYAVSLHGVGLSLGSAGGIDGRHLARVAALAERIEPALVSEHLSWSATGGAYLNDLLPLPYTAEALAVVASNLGRMQDALRRPVLIENPSGYLRFAGSTLAEADFLAELARRTGCRILCDVNNIHVSCANLGGDPPAYLAALPAWAVGELHLAGHHANETPYGTVLIDDHGSAVREPVWRLYEAAVRRFPAAPTLVEWDNRIPPLAVLAAEAEKADARRAAALQGADHALAA